MRDEGSWKLHVFNRKASRTEPASEMSLSSRKGNHCLSSLTHDPRTADGHTTSRGHCQPLVLLTPLLGVRLLDDEGGCGGGGGTDVASSVDIASVGLGSSFAFSVLLSPTG